MKKYYLKKKKNNPVNNTLKYNYVLLNIEKSNAIVSECLDQTYGPGCRESCGHCKNNEPCKRANGSCPNGCDRGTYGQKCNLGTYIQNEY